MRRALILFYCAALAACAAQKVAPPSATWEQRLKDLQHATVWQLDGRAAVAVGTQGWQATLNWRQDNSFAELHLSGPFGIGALVVRQGPDGLALNGAPPSDAVLSQLKDRMGFEPPLDDLRFWLLGVPDPGAAYEVVRNDQDRAQQLTQDGWKIVYDRYLPIGGDLLPARLVLSRDAVRVRIVIDHWERPR